MTRITTQPDKYIGGDFTNTYDGEPLLFLFLGIFTFGLGFCIFPAINNMLCKSNPSAYYRVKVEMIHNDNQN